MTRTAVENLYGPPDETLEITVPGGGAGLLARYNVHGGELIVTYANGRVVSVSTSAPFYKTKGGAGPGAGSGKLDGLGLEEDFCSFGLWDGGSADSPDDVVTVFQRDGDEIGVVTITQLGFYDLCTSAGNNGEVADPRPATFQLTVRAEPPGGGWIRSSPYLIDCPDACVRPFDRDTVVTLETHPTNGFTFKGWDGACKGTGACVVTMDEAKAVVARYSGAFVRVPPPPKPSTGTTG